MIQPKISVIVPVYNVEPYLSKCLNSIINQTYRNLEIILIDDGSPDSCGAICDEYAAHDMRIQVIHTENRGTFASRNSALDIATGEFISFVDADDWLAPQMYETLLGLITDYNADVAQCEAVNQGKYTQIRSKTVGGVVCYPRESLTQEFFRETITHGLPTKLFRAGIWRERRFLEGYYHIDAVVLSQLEDFCDSLVRTDEALYYYNTTNLSITRGRKTLLHLQSMQVLFDAYSIAANKVGPSASLFICQEIPCFGRIIPPTGEVSVSAAKQHIRYMHTIFSSHWPKAISAKEYKGCPISKRFLWHIYFKAPLVASLLSYTRGRIYELRYRTLQR